MPFRQPAQTAFRQNDFKNKAFSFPVESVLKPERGFGKLFIEVSDGYLLMTSQQKEPKSVLVLDHVLQPDGSRIAQSIVTVKAVREESANGTVTIRNCSESRVIPIEGLAGLNQGPLMPILSISHSVPVFPDASPGRPSVLAITFTQQHADTPVRLMTSDPKRFQFAMDVESSFAPGLMFTPSATGTQILARYTPDTLGQHIAFLTVDAPYEKKNIVLTGHSKLPVASQPPASPLSDRSTVQEPRPLLPGGPVPMAIALTIVGILISVGYVYRCTIAPELCRPLMALDRPTVMDPSAEEAMAGQSLNRFDRADTLAVAPLETPTVYKETESVTSAVPDEPDRNEKYAIEKPKRSRPKIITDQPSVRAKRPAAAPMDATSEAVMPSQPQADDASVTAESSLERELNRKVKH